MGESNTSNALDKTPQQNAFNETNVIPEGTTTKKANATNASNEQWCHTLSC